LPQGPREILERYDVGPSQLESFFSGEPLSPSENDVLVKILYHLPRMGLENLQRWRQPGVAWDHVASAPAEYRAKVFHLEGRVQRVERQELLPEQAELLEFRYYYRVTLALADSPHVALVCASQVPSVWPLDGLLDERAETDALFLKVGDAAADPPQLVFAAGRMAWLPDRLESERGVGPAQLALASRGMDIGLWEQVRELNGRPIVEADRETFYQLLAAVGRSDALSLKAADQAPLNLVPLLERPAQKQGDVFHVAGIARRVVKVEVSEQDIQSRFGLDHYYEIELSLPLGDVVLRLGDDATGEKNPIYDQYFPGTLHVRHLPPGLSIGEKLSQPIEANAVFYRLWSFRSAYMDKYNGLQAAPLFMANQPRIAPAPRSATWLTGGLVAAAFGIIIATVGVMTWWNRRLDRSLSAQRRAALNSQPPDFSRLH
jgi:hypothetical protein